MAMSGVTELANRIPELWAPQMYAELRNQLLIANSVSREYEGVLSFGDTVKVQTLVAPTGEILTDDEASFSSEAMTVNNFNIVVNKRASASFEISDMAQLQSMSFQAEAQEALVYAIRKQLENDLITAIHASAAVSINPATPSDLGAIDLASARTALSINKVPLNNRLLFLAPSYYGDLLNKNTITSLDFVAGRNAEAGVVSNFMGFQIAEHNLFAADKGIAMHPSAIQLVMQQDIRVKVSDLHPTGKYGYKVSADFVYGYSISDTNRIIIIEAP